MMNLLIDAGNTSIKMAASRDDKFYDEIRCNTDTFKETVEWYLDKYKSVDVVAISDVRGLPEELYEFLESISNRVLNVKGEINIPINNKYSTPETLGADRLCAAIGAWSMFPNQNCVIIDFGTAITIDFLKENGDFVGGNISLGLSTRFKALNHFTGKLPLLEKSDEVPQIGTTTAEAMRAGVVLGTIFEIEGYIRSYPGYNFIFTGGDAIFFAEKLKSPIFAVRNLVLMGLSQIIKTNVI